MRTSSIALAIAAMSLTAAAFAVPQDPLAQVTVSPAGRHLVLSSDLQAVHGTYALSNDQRLKVWNRYTTLIAELDGQSAVEFVSLGNNVFVSKDQTMKLVFDDEPLETYVTVTMPAASAHVASSGSGQQSLAESRAALASGAMVTLTSRK